MASFLLRTCVKSHTYSCAPRPTVWLKMTRLFSMCLSEAPNPKNQTRPDGKLRAASVLCSVLSPRLGMHQVTDPGVSSTSGVRSTPSSWWVTSTMLTLAWPPNSHWLCPSPTAHQLYLPWHRTDTGKNPSILWGNRTGHQQLFIMGLWAALLV